MHSIATAVTTDFHKRFGRQKTDEQLLRYARWLTVLLGVAGTASSAMMATIEIKYMWDMFLGVVGMLLSTVAGLMTLGIFSRRATGLHAWLGALASVAALYY